MVSPDRVERNQQGRMSFLDRLRSGWSTTNGGFGVCPVQWSGGANVSSLESETETLLRMRLRAASFVLFLGFAAFLGTYFVGAVQPPRTLFWLHILVTLDMAVCSVVLCERYGWRLKHLRAFEYVVFGLPIGFLTYLQFVEARAFAEYCVAQRSGDLMFALNTELAIPWICLMFIYTSFIPNTWRRAAVHVAPMVAIPLAVYVCACFYNEYTWSHLWSRSLLTMSLWLGLAASASVFGTYTYNALRRRAALAREFGSYQLKQRIGAGGMGEVYLGEHKLLKRPCAIKLIRPHRAADPKALARFESEVQASAKLTHWNTIEIFDYGHTEDGTFYYAMEYLPGMSLQDLVDRYGPIPTERAIHFLLQVCDALNEAHGMGLIHRDIKPGNVFASHRGGYWDVAKLLDFGLVKSIAPESETNVAESSDGVVLGTPLFASPEWTLNGGVLDERSDIYSLGAVGYFLATGRPVFNHPSAMKLLFAHAHEPVPPIRDSHPEVPEDFEAVILRCLEKRPQDRFASARDLYEALENCRSAGAWTTERAAAWWSVHNDSWRGAAMPESDPSADTQVLEVAQMA
jgi:serine/threonine-protein kinase